MLSFPACDRPVTFILVFTFLYIHIYIGTFYPTLGFLFFLHCAGLLCGSFVAVTLPVLLAYFYSAISAVCRRWRFPRRVPCLHDFEFFP